MYFKFAVRCCVVVAVGTQLPACGTLIAPYDSTFDQSLNKLSEDTAKFLAAAQAGGPERSATSKETTTYYAATYNVLDRLLQRARLTRGLVPCPTDASLKTFARVPTSTTVLPDDYEKLDCREFQLYAVRLYVDQLHYGQTKHGVLTPSEARALGGILQTSIMGAIQTFVVNRAGP
jgi:hypothetical protein